VATRRLNLNKTLLSCTAKDLPDNLVGAAVLRMPDGVLQHAGIFVRYNGQSKLFHYPGHDNKIHIENLNLGEQYFFKELDFIDRDLLKSVIMHCEVVVKEAKPRYGFYYTGGYYDDAGDLIGVKGHPQYMTCVGFCLSFLKNYLEGQDLMRYEDWDKRSVDDEEVHELIKRVTRAVPDIDIEKFSKGLRRIRPKEYLAAAFGTPTVNKEFTDEVFPKIEKHLDQTGTSAKEKPSKSKSSNKRA
jgi:hypothetical protein